jgi:hypothetical protein
MKEDVQAMHHNTDEIWKDNSDIKDFIEILIGDKKFLNERQYKTAEYFIKNYRYIKYVQSLETDENGNDMTDEKREGLLNGYPTEPYCDYIKRVSLQRSVG